VLNNQINFRQRKLNIMITDCAKYRGYQLHTTSPHMTDALTIDSLNKIVSKRISLYRYLLELKAKLVAQQDAKQGQDNQGYKQRIEPNEAKGTQQGEKVKTAHDEDEDVFLEEKNLLFNRQDFIDIQKLNIELYEMILPLQKDLKLQSNESLGRKCSDTANECMISYNIDEDWTQRSWTHVCSGKEEVPSIYLGSNKNLEDFIKFVTDKITENTKLIVPVCFGVGEPGKGFGEGNHHCFVLEINSKDDWEITQSYADLYKKQTSKFDPILWQKLIWTDNPYLEPGTFCNIKRNAEMLFGSSNLVNTGNLRQGMDFYIKVFSLKCDKNS